MKRLAVILAVILLFPSIGQAADLEAGWYVKLGLVTLWGFDGVQETAVRWDFVGGLGQHEDFQVTSPSTLWPERLITVTTTRTGVPEGTGVTLQGTPRTTLNFDITRIDVTCETDYDASNLRLEAWLKHTEEDDEMLWSQNLSGHTYGTAELLSNSYIMKPGDNLYFRLAATAVPEPQSASIVMMGMAVIACRLRRRRAQ